MSYLRRVLLISLILYLLSPVSPAHAADYYISPTGSDTNSGTAVSSPLATFTKAWTLIHPGDTLYLLDGTYTITQAGANQTAIIYPTVNGTAGQWITIKALHDGHALLDGQNSHMPVLIGQEWSANDPNPQNTNPQDTPPNPYGNYINLEGLVAKNSSSHVYEVTARNVTLRRDSGYNANPHKNTHVFTVWAQGDAATPANILIEDCIAAGTGRKMILAYDTYNQVVFRRNFAAWQGWLGDQFCDQYWPQCDGIEVYPAAYADQPDILNNSLVENNIYFGLTPDYGTSLSPNTGFRAGNHYYGDISLGAGMRWDNTQSKFIPADFNSQTCTYNGITKPAVCSNTTCINLQANPSFRAGYDFGVYATPDFRNNTFKDLFAAYNAGLGISAGPWYVASTNNSLTDSTFVLNGQAPSCDGSASANCTNFSNTDTTSLSSFSTVQNLKVGHGSNPSPGTGAHLQNRYLDGTLTGVSLWPWPMEDRIKTELADPNLFQANTIPGQVWTNFSVTDIVCQSILLPNGAVTSCPTTPVPTPTPGPSPTPSPTPIPTITPTPSPTPIGGAPVMLIDAGASVDTVINGQTWKADNYYSGGATMSYPDTITGTTIPQIYQTERFWDNTPRSYSIPLSNGPYVVKLHFAENYTGITGAGQRVFSVNVEGTPLNDLDVFAEAGGRNKALVKTFAVTVTDNNLTITFTPQTQNPFIDGIEVENPAAAPLQGDFNSDGVVDWQDWLSFIPNFGKALSQFQLVTGSLVSIFDLNQLIGSMFK